MSRVASKLGGRLFWILGVATLLASGSSNAGVVFQEDYESGWGSWWTDNGVWDVDTPCDPPEPHGGSNVAGTILCGNYPSETDSRLISPTSQTRVFGVKNDSGTIDIQGNRIETVDAFRAPMITRGNQDSYTGYGKKWNVIREFPDPYVASFLNSPDRAYFNFEGLQHHKYCQ